MTDLNKYNYKQTAIGLIPNDWEAKKLGELSSIKTGKKDNQNKTEGGIYPFFVRSKNIERINSYSFEGEAILIPGEGNIGEIFHYINGKFDYHQRVYKISDFNKNTFGKFIYYYFQIFFLKETVRHSVKATVDSLRLPTFTEMIIHLPTLTEQKKIAEILTTWDIAINTSKSILEELITQKKWLAYNLLFNRKKDSNNFVPLSKLLNRVKSPFEPDPQKQYKQIGIRSHAKGIFYKEEVSGLSLGNKSVFHIEPNCFILNIVFAWEHAIAKTTLNETGMIASHRFPMFKPVADKLDLDYLLHFFKSQKGKNLLALASPGGAGRNKTLGQSDFLKLKIPVPNIEEQKIIAQVLDKADEEILLYKEKIASLQLQKKGLMQQLLTGKVRVKI